jgi:signal peptidase I
MMPTLLKGDRLVVTKFPYGWSWVSPSFHILPPFKGRLFGSLPQQGDVVIVTPPGRSDDYIKRVVARPGDTVEVRAGQLYLNGKPVKRVLVGQTMIPVDANVPCNEGLQLGHRQTGKDGKEYCELTVYRETLPNGRSYDTIDFGYHPEGPDDYGPVVVPEKHVFLMGDNRDQSADSRVALAGQGLGGPVPWENIGGRAEFITFSLDGTTQLLNPISWFRALRGGRAGTSLHAAIDPTVPGK